MILLISLVASGLLPLFAEGRRSHGDRISEFSSDILKTLAERTVPDQTGAVGRNRKGYFHVRFQMGVHRLANYALAEKDPRGIDHFLNAMEYSLSHQQPDGRFSFVIPQELDSEKGPSDADRASGVAFFLSSAGTGIDALMTSSWFQETPEFQPFRDRCERIVQRLEPTIAALLEDEPFLRKADLHAPNRLLFDAAAFLSLGKAMKNDEATAAGERFLDLASELIHEDGFFIERGGSDTSYNGVAAATALRIGLLLDSSSWVQIGLDAVSWQTTRISTEGEISTEGNTRVRPGGESFLGREKDVDVGHTIEALSFASCLSENPALTTLAKRVLGFYQR
ncbi:MAG: hypothetical protein AAGC68_14075 [Verrucomicrobiota bacterium]